MKQFEIVLQEFRKWFTSFAYVNKLLPHHHLILFGGLALLCLSSITTSFFGFFGFFFFWSLFSLLNTLAYYAFYTGIFLSLASGKITYLPFALWGYALYIFIPFFGFSTGFLSLLGSLLGLVIFGLLGYWLKQFNDYQHAQETATPPAAVNSVTDNTTKEAALEEDVDNTGTDTAVKSSSEKAPENPSEEKNQSLEQ